MGAIIESADVGGLCIPRIINGMWQVAGGHGPINPDSAVSDMQQYHDAGLVAWDMADIYGPAEEFFGRFRGRLKPEQRDHTVAFTKFVPNPGPMDRRTVRSHVAASLDKMGVERIDLLQFHWWDYGNISYMDALHHLQDLHEDGLISNLALTNFDTQRMQIIADAGIKIASNQVQHSILDCRPQHAMAAFCSKYGARILAYGTLLGGLLSERYLGAAEPDRADLATSSLQKYKDMINAWGGWALFQELLEALDAIAKAHDASIANVAVRYVLEMPAVAGAIIGARLGVSDHICENLRVFSLRLEPDDYLRIQEVTGRANDLYSVIGDCGSEYR